MKLYNIFKKVINEGNGLINESVSDDNVKSAITDKYNVNILYKDYDDKPPSRRYIQVYVLGITKAGNKAIRVYQIFGGSKSNDSSNWKIFLLDKIEGWYPTNVKWVRPVSDLANSIPKYNEDGDKSFNYVLYQADKNKLKK